ncbi:MATE family efflux transporter [Traorella massiliensis]|uniref:MATE family efflux transporter n=1 Tax=Traorella massiliensis TaxID=1903263 RepID=UPI002353914C|nr:MATE family efflux transporter [Traorella massiliensis]
MNQSANLGQGSVGKLLFKLALPAIVAQIINVLYNMVDRMYIGHIEGIGDVALTGVGVTMPIIMAVSAFAALVSMGSAPRASIMMGRKKNDEAENILGNSFVLLIVIAIITTALILIFGWDLPLFFGASENTVQYGWSYLQIYACGTIFVQLTLGLNAFISAQGFSTEAMKTILIGAILNIILDPIFMFPLNMGVQGAALATILSQAVSCVWVILFLCGKKTSLKLKKKYMTLRPSVFLPCIALGLSPFIMQFTESVITVCFNTSLLKYGGDIAVGAMTILSSVMQFSMLPLQGMTQGSQPIVSYNYGAGNLDRVKKTFTYLLVSCMIYSTTLWAISVFTPQLFVSIFTDKPELAAYTQHALQIYMSTSCLFGAQIACQQTFIALGNAKTSVFLAVLRKIILLIPLIYILPNFFADQAIAVFMAEPVADFLAVCTTVTLFTIYFKHLLTQKAN